MAYLRSFLVFKEFVQAEVYSLFFIKENKTLFFMMKKIDRSIYFVKHFFFRDSEWLSKHCYR